MAKLKSAAAILREAWLLPRVPPDDAIFQDLLSLAGAATDKPRGLRRYLEEYPAIGRIVVDQDWTHDRASGELRLAYSNSLFARGCIRLRPGAKEGATLVFLPGNMAGADDVLGSRNRPQNMTAVAQALNMGLACWDWPLQGWRRDRCLYRGLRSLYSAEREYSRILPTLGTCLWREYVAELQFALAQIGRFVGAQTAIHVVGWSMGGCFAYLAPLLGTRLKTATAIGSCARTKDLLARGKTRVQGYFFYPLNGLRYFDLEDIVIETLNSNCSLKIVCGERDPGCLEETLRTLRVKASQTNRSLEITVLAGLGHEFSTTLKDRIVEILKRSTH